MTPGLIDALAGHSTWIARDVFFVFLLGCNAGGIVWLAKNHFHTVNKKLDEISVKLDAHGETIASIKERVARIEGQLNHEAQ